MNKRLIRKRDLRDEKDLRDLRDCIRRISILASFATILLVLLPGCTTAGHSRNPPILSRDFYEPPSYLIAWPNFSLLLPPTYGSNSFTAIKMRKRGKKLIISGSYHVDETYPKIKYDLRHFGFKAADAPGIKCYWANPDGTLAELNRL